MAIDLASNLESTTTRKYLIIMAFTIVKTDFGQLLFLRKYVNVQIHLIIVSSQIQYELSHTVLFYIYYLLKKRCIVFLFFVYSYVQRWVKKENWYPTIAFRESQLTKVANMSHLSGNWMHWPHWLAGYLKRLSKDVIFFSFPTFQLTIKPDYQKIRNPFFERCLKSIQLSVFKV